MIHNKPMLNAYPDSIGGSLSGMVQFLQENSLQNAFSSFYVLPSLYHSDLDRGFCVIDYDINENLASRQDLEDIKNMGIDLKLDFVLNHASANSPQFQDLVKNGQNSPYKDFFIDWNAFWKGHGVMGEDGWIIPDQKYLEKMFFRKPGLPVLMVEMPDGSRVPYWNTFYQKVWEEDGQKKYSGQMDLNIQSEKVWDFYKDVLTSLAGYGARIIRLDAFAYAGKAVGEPNFLNEPQTWQVLERVKNLAQPLGLELLPEIHASYSEGRYAQIARQGYMTYDFFLPGLLIDAMENHDASVLAKWAQELVDEKISTVNMLGCHDGIPMLDLKGLLDDDRIQALIDTIVARGGHIKNLHGQKNMYYQINATYYSALGEDDAKMLLARAVQMFMPGKPQVWYLDLLAGTNDYEAMEKAGADGHKEINRSNLSLEQAREKMQQPVVQKQVELLNLRNSHPAFAPDAHMEIEAKGPKLEITWTKDGDFARLQADFETMEYNIEAS